MIKHWYFDDGEPHYMTAIDSWSEERRPAWRCQWWDLTTAEDVARWLDENCGLNAEHTLRFNSGSPYMQIEIYRERDAVAFKLTWGSHQSE